MNAAAPILKKADYKLVVDAKNFKDLRPFV
jgi:electron transfer flavoprotein alpha subunit